MTVDLVEVAAARRFTRAFTREVELLNEDLLGSRFSLSEARVLFELGSRTACTAATLSRELGMDPGYLSRMLKRFEAGGLLDRAPSIEDGRLAVLTLSGEGREAFASLDARSREQWTRRLHALPVDHRAGLVDAMATVERLLPAARAAGPITLREHRVGDLGWVTHRQGLLYAREYGWDASFEALVAEILAAFVREHDPARERGWIADRDGTVLGSVYLVRQSDAVAKLRLLYVERETRGEGLGARLVGECISFARERGYRTLTLWTNDCLHAARRIYEKVGFRLAEEERHRSFGHDLVGQNWTLAL